MYHEHHEDHYQQVEKMIHHNAITKNRMSQHHLLKGKTNPYQEGCQKSETTLMQLQEHLTSTDYSLQVATTFCILHMCSLCMASMEDQTDSQKAHSSPTNHPKACGKMCYGLMTPIPKCIIFPLFQKVCLVQIKHITKRTLRTQAEAL